MGARGWGPHKQVGYFRLHIRANRRPAFSFNHDRGKNSTFHSPQQSGIKHAEILRINGMSKKELKTEINTWEH